MADPGSAILHATIHLSGEGCCCPARDVACPSCPRHAGPDAVPCPICGQAAEAEVRALREALQEIVEADADAETGDAGADRRWDAAMERARALAPELGGG